MIALARAMPGRPGARSGLGCGARLRLGETRCFLPALE